MRGFIFFYLLLINILFLSNEQRVCAQFSSAASESQLFIGDTLTASVAAKEVGKKVLVKAKIVGIHTAKNAKGRPTFIDLDARFPNNSLVIVIFEQNIAKFAPVEDYKDKTVLIEGLVRRRVYKYRGKEHVRSQIELKTPASIIIIE